MAKIKDSGVKTYMSHKVSRPGVHAKTKTSKLRSSKNYKKSYRGQGRWLNILYIWMSQIHSALNLDILDEKE